MSPGLAQVVEEGRQCTGGRESDPPHVQTATLSAKHSFRDKSSPALTAHTRDTGPLHMQMTQAQTWTQGCSHIHTHTHPLAESQICVFSHGQSSSGLWGIVCCGHVTARSDMRCGWLMGRPHTCSGHQQSGSCP